jgi:hypothetical protein
MWGITIAIYSVLKKKKYKNNKDNFEKNYIKKQKS